MNCHTASGAGGGGGGAVASLDFDGATDYLTNSNANWGSYTRTKFAIAGAFRTDSLASARNITNKMTGAGAGQEYRVEITTSGSLRFVGREASLNTSEFDSVGSIVLINTWYSFLIHYDSANGTSADRIKMWVNNSPVASLFYTAPGAAVQTTATQTSVGQWDGGQYMSGLIYSLAFFDNVLPTTAEIFDGAAGKLQNLSAVTGLKSLLTGSTATDDSLLADWTNNGTVTTSATVP